MTKNVWVQPQTVVQQFVANEAVSACGDENKVYKFTCEAGGGGNGTVYLDSDHDGEWNLLYDEILTLAGYHACGVTHEAPTTDDFKEGFFITGVIPPYNVQKVIVWRGEDGHNVHCTTNLDMTTWPTAKS